jgi:hexosaminidase
MIRRGVLFLLALSAHAVMPLPVKVAPGAGRMVIDNGFQIVISGVSDPRLDAAAARAMTRLARQTGIPFLGSKPTATLRVECAAKGNEYPVLGEDESYTLDITAEGAVAKAATVDGAMHGVETFLQLVGPGPGGFQAAAVHIEDRPRFAWRGLMLDSGRHWMPVAVVKRNLDAMAAVKLNVFHWHLSEDQGFRVESKRYPKLHEVGSDGLYYTQAEVREIVAYARERGIRVVPEFDIPGHTQSWLAAYPELATNSGTYAVGRTWGIYEPVMDPSKEWTYQFLDGFFAEMTPLFPDPYWHIGGDEVRDTQWKASEHVQAWAKEHNLKDSHAIQAYFNQRVQKLLQKYNKILIGWDEVLHPDLPQDIVVQSWRGARSLAKAASKGYRGILSWATIWITWSRHGTTTLWIRWGATRQS